MHTDLRERIRELEDLEKPFAVATVVRAEKPTSAKAGARAVITADGDLEGWIGGSCAEPSVKREARNALREGVPRLVRLCPPEQLGRAPQEGVVEIALTCISGGTLEIYIEPQHAQPHLVVIGHLETARALARLGAAMAWRVTVLGLDVSRGGFPDGVRTVDGLDFGALRLTPHANVIVASHGNYDEDMLVAALASPARYVALVSSRKRSEAIHEYLEDSGLTPEQIARLKVPAGLDLGAVTPEEIALSILAEIITRRGAERAAGESAPEDRETADPVLAREAVDPVCEMRVVKAGAHFTSEVEGRMYYFCCAGCKRAFDADPAKYIQEETGRVL